MGPPVPVDISNVPAFAHGHIAHWNEDDAAGAIQAFRDAALSIDLL
jgi:hypothetical protein